MWIAWIDGMDVSFMCSSVGVRSYVRLCRLFYYNSGVSNGIFPAKIYKILRNEHILCRNTTDRKFIYAN